MTTARTTRRARYGERTGADAVMALPVSYWKLSEREIFKHSLSIGAAIRHFDHAYNKPATSGVDMGPELLVQMFVIHRHRHNVKVPNGDLSG